MRRLLLSDIHSNIEALDSSLERARRAGFDAVLCCGDVVGYGPDPNEAIDRLRAADALTIRGNHDRVASGQDEPTDFNVHAAQAALWTRAALDPDSIEFLRSLPVGPLQVEEGVELVHGAVTDEDDYIISSLDAAESFDLTASHLVFFGHTHVQSMYSLGDRGSVRPERVEVSDDVALLRLRKGLRYLVNPGSVGQPRDNDIRAAFAIWDSEDDLIEFYRSPYPLETTQEKMRRADLPAYLIDRLGQGR